MRRISTYPHLRDLYIDMMKDVAFLLCYSIELYHNVTISSAVTKQVGYLMASAGGTNYFVIFLKAQETGFIFHILNRADIRLKRSVSHTFETFHNLYETSYFRLNHYLSKI